MILKNILAFILWCCLFVPVMVTGDSSEFSDMGYLPIYAGIFHTICAITSIVLWIILQVYNERS